MENIMKLAGYQRQYFSVGFSLQTIYSKPHILQVKQWRFRVVRQLSRGLKGFSACSSRHSWLCAWSGHKHEAIAG